MLSATNTNAATLRRGPTRNLQLRGRTMAASVIRSSGGFGLPGTVQTCYFPEENEVPEDEYEEDFREEGDSFEEDSLTLESQEEDTWSTDPSNSQTEMTNQLLHFAELISSDVQRYFGCSQNLSDCDIYAERESPEVSGRQRYYSDFIRVASSEQGKEPEKLGPLAELFEGARRKKQGLPMSQRHLPSSFWTEPCPCLPSTSNIPDILNCSKETMSINISTPVSTLSTSDTPVTTISSSTTPDFSDLLAHWSSERDPSEFNCDY